MTKQLRADRAKIFEQMKAMSAAAEKENRNLNADEQANYDKANADAAALKVRYERIENEQAMERELSESAGSVVRAKSAIITPGTASDEQYRSAFHQYLRTGDAKQFRDLNTTTPADGGYTVPVVILNQIKTALARQSFVRKAGASVLTTGVRTTIPVGNLPV